MWVAMMFLAAAVAVAAAVDVSMSLRDHPIAATGTPTYLDGGVWTASTENPVGADYHDDQPPGLNLTVTATVPGDLLTDLQRAGVIADPWLDTTWIANASLWTEHAWTYTTRFAVSEAVAGLAKTSTLLLTFDGVKMGATVRVNGHTVGVLSDQFLRYSFPLDPETFGLQVGSDANRLDITFGIEDVAEDGRFMACTGGWDWAPYSYTSTNSSGATTGPANTLSKGIWKSVYTTDIPRATVAITHLTPHLHYNGAYPTARLADGKHGGFTVNVTAHLWAPSGGASGNLAVAGSWAKTESTAWASSTATGTAGAAASSGIRALPAGPSMISLQITATAAQIGLWWPNGVGPQPLYDIQATWTPTPTPTPATADTANPPPPIGLPHAPAAPVTVASRRMGFRVFALVTFNDTNATIVAANASNATTGQVNDTGTHGMFFRVNGAPLYSRGANMIPMEELEGRMDAEAHRILVKSSADAGMNTLRVWGGGIFYPDAFYDACDEYGVLVYHDMQYTSTGGGTHGPVVTVTQDAELRHQIRRMSHHPAIVIWDGNNENPVNAGDPSGLFASFVMTVVAQEDMSRAVWPSSPARGWATGVDRLYQTPSWDNPEGLTTKGGGHSWTGGIESHAPYQTGGGWPTVNGGIDDSCFIDNGMGNGVNLPSVFSPPHGELPPPRPADKKCFAAVQSVCADHLTSYMDCYNCRNTVPGAWDKIRPACGAYPISTYHETCKSFFPTPAAVPACGVGQLNVYASEFGTTGSSSFESMSGVLSEQHWGLHAGMPPDACDADVPGSARCVGQHLCNGTNPMSERNYACDGAIRLFFGNRTTIDIDATGEAAFKGQMYQCQLVQAVVLKQIYEARRAQNAFGHLVWMLNEIWPTVGWGSLEYGPPPGFTPGQVRGGRWKPLHYFYKNALMTDVMATCGDLDRSQNGTSACYVSNHGAGVTFEGTVTLTAYDHFGTGVGAIVLQKPLAMAAGPGALDWFNVDLPPGNTTSVISTVQNEHGAVVSEHMVQLVKPKDMRVPEAKLTFAIADAANTDGTIDIIVSSDKVAVWVTLTTLAQGRFSDNAFFLPATKKTIHFIPFSPSTAADDHHVLSPT